MNTTASPLKTVNLSASFNRVDREARVIYGVKLAQLGPFETRRGQFTSESFEAIMNLYTQDYVTQNGLPMRFGHAELGKDHLTKVLGRVRNLRREGEFVVGDQHYLPLAFETPIGGGRPYGEFIFDLAEQDSKQMETSFVLIPDIRHDLAENGEPPVWIPKALAFSDVVGNGDANHTGFLSITEPQTKEPEPGEQLMAADYQPQVPQAVISEDQLAKLEERILSAFTPKIQPLVNLAEQNEAAQELAALEAKNARIVYLCKLHGKDAADAATLIDQNLSVDEVVAQLSKERELKNQLPDLGQVPGTGAGQTETLSASDKLYAQLSAEYDEESDFYRNTMSLSKQEYINARAIAVAPQVDVDVDEILDKSLKGLAAQLPADQQHLVPESFAEMKRRNPIGAALLANTATGVTS